MFRCGFRLLRRFAPTFFLTSSKNQDARPSCRDPSRGRDVVPRAEAILHVAPLAIELGDRPRGRGQVRDDEPGDCYSPCRSRPTVMRPTPPRSRARGGRAATPARWVGGGGGRGRRGGWRGGYPLRRRGGLARCARGTRDLHGTCEPSRRRRANVRTRSGRPT